MATDKETIDQLAWDNYWKKNPGKALAENTRPDMVIGYVDGWNAAKENYSSLENMREAVKTMKEGVNIMKEVSAAYEAGWNANPAQYTEEDMLAFHEYCRDSPQLTHQQLLQQYKLTQNQQ